ncbi:MAG: winged helix-turn-helix transcriptional regulator [Paenibacillus sp.]|nr:winged helix-turn-helix transcriptional regulator [Paenibacillus sp.]
MAEFDKANLTRPTFKVEQGGIATDIPREIFMSIRGGVKPIRINQDRTKIELKSNQNRTKTEQKNQIVEMIKSNHQISRVELSVQLGLHESSVQRRLDALVKEGRLRHIGPTNGGSWEVIE